MAGAAGAEEPICRPTGTAANNCGSGTNSQTLGWDAEGKLATVSAGGQTVETNIYDADGTRIIRRDSGGTTLYLPGQEIRREGGVNTGTRYYSFAGTVCASRTGGSASTDLTWLFNDHQGTQQVAVNAGTQAVSIRRQTPYGAPRGANPVWVNNKGFVGGDIDPTGLTNVGARQYDLTLGRFISVDPVLVADSPAQYNGYQYGGNNPIDNADPTGLYFTENGEDTGDRAYVDTTPFGNNDIKIVKKYVPPACGSACQQQREAFRQASNERAERERKQRECQSSFWCRNAGAVGAVAGVAAGVIVGGACTAGSFGVGAVGCAAIGGFVGGYVASLTTNSLDADEESFLQLAGEAVLGGAIGGVLGAGGAVLLPALGAGAFGLASGAGLRTSVGMAGAGARSAARGGGVGGACGFRSFSGDTEVLMADGSKKPIEDVEIGDVVLATDPETGEEGAREVTHLWVHEDQLVDLKVSGGEVTTTEDHPFWNVTDQQWQDSQDLDPGDLLHTANGATLTVTGVDWNTTRQGTAYNLTVADIHTYYVLAGNTPVLVHNTNCSTNAQILGDNLEASRVARPAETAAHHIVASTSPKAAAARAQLNRFGIGINDASNGVFLPRGSASANPGAMSVHSRIHTNDYYAYVNDMMSGARNAGEARDVLNHIRGQLQGGYWP
ncbi:hypothetical protein Jiend_33400 [Micromonospora endophytica]|nr:hypothetical protein Jiend_33400 [Micromonospora endophytica]